MSELLVQDKYLIHFFVERADGLQYKEVKANTVSKDLIIESDLFQFISSTKLNKTAYSKLLRKFKNDEKQLMEEFCQFLSDRIRASMNMAIFINTNKSVTFEGVKLHLFYTSGSVIHGDELFDENIFSVVQELPYIFRHDNQKIYSFRPDLTFFVNGIFLGYSELKSNYNNQNARKNGRVKVINDYQNASIEYLKIAHDNDDSHNIRKDFLKIFEKAIHITATDINDTYVIRNISNYFDDIKVTFKEGKYDYEDYRKKAIEQFKSYPLRNSRADRTTRFEEIFKALYSKKMIEKEILYYNFIERTLEKKKTEKEYKDKTGKLISPRPKQKFGADKIMDKISEFWEHEKDDEYFINKLKEQLQHLSESQRNELIEKRQKYQNNKNVYSLLLQYAAGFGKSNIIGWTALQLKDIRVNNEYVYDKVMLIVDRVQLRDQLDSKMVNMNIDNKMFIEANNKEAFIASLKSDTRIVVVNLQKFATIKEVLEPDVIAHLAGLRIAFLIDEIHRSNSGVQHEAMISLFDELQSSFDNNTEYLKRRNKKNLIIGFTATPSDNSLARFGEYNKYAEAEKIWIPYDSYTMREAIADGYILNPLRGIVPVSSKMFFELRDNIIEGFEGDTGYQDIPDGTDTGVDTNGKKYRIRKRRIYDNEDRIEAISKFVVERLVSSVYHNIRGTAKAMLAVSSIKSAIRYKGFLDKYYAEITEQKKYERFKDAPISIVYSSDGQAYPSSNSLNNNLSEARVLQNFALAKNGLMIVVDKLQTGFNEPKLHTLFLDKEISGINAIQTISRVNRTTKNKNDCKIIDFSYKNVNVGNIKKAFEHFSNVVVSDFDPLSDEQVIAVHYKEMIEHDVYKEYFSMFCEYLGGNETNIQILLDIEDGFVNFIRGYKTQAQALKKKINHYFRILNLIEFVIQIDCKYRETKFLEFWRRFNNEYNNIMKPKEIIDDVEIYFDNKIGIIEPVEKNTESKKTKKGATGATEDNQYKFDILAVIAKRNQEEEAIEELIKDFELKIEQFFEYIPTHRNGLRLNAKILDTGSAFDEDEIYEDFETIYKAFERRNRDMLGNFFIKETKDILKQLCDDYERYLKQEK